LRKREEEKEAKERRALIDAAIRGEAKRKKKSKRARETGESSVVHHLIFLLRIISPLKLSGVGVEVEIEGADDVLLSHVF
jgi:hypothetical protein